MTAFPIEWYFLSGKKMSNIAYISRREQPMPQQDMSSKIGKSSSPVIDRVIQNNKNVQKVVPVPGVVKSGQYNKATVKV